MRALSFSQPWLWSVLHAGKRIENRTWPPPIHMIGQRFALHAAKSFDKDGVSFLMNLGLGPEMPARFDLYPKSCIVGVATIDRVVTVDKTLPDDQRRWFFGPFGWALTEVREVCPHIPCNGGLGLWTLSEGLHGSLLKALELRS